MGWRQSWHLNMESCNIVRSRSLSPYLKQSGCSMRSPINVISAVSCWKGWPQWLHFWEACTAAHIAHNIVIMTQSLPLVSNLLQASVIMTFAADNETILIQKIFRLNVAATELTLETLRVVQLLTGMRNAGIYLFPQYIWKILSLLWSTGLWQIYCKHHTEILPLSALKSSLFCSENIVFQDMMNCVCTHLFLPTLICPPIVSCKPILTLFIVFFFFQTVPRVSVETHDNCE